MINCNLARVNANGQPSQTALTAAAARAAHLVVDGQPRIFTDTLAGAMLGERAEEFIAYHPQEAQAVTQLRPRSQVSR